ncbi:MAG TPA: MFS transporter [Anaerolineae bacterium]|nr:MFS transporter [Anaerolineae bacterium]
MQSNGNQPKSMKTFLVIWFGQLISIIGSGLTGFGLSVWIFTQTGDATPFALNALAYNLPRILIQPIAGSVADRFNRKKIMIISDTGAALVTLVVAGLLFTDNLQVWHIYLTTAISSLFSAFQDPAYRSSITMIVAKKDLARAGGMQQIGSATNLILVPMLAAFLYAAVGLRGVILIDFATFFFAIGALLVVHIPQPERKTQPSEDGKSSMLKDVGFAWNYLRERPGLFGLLWFYAAVNFFLSLSGPLWGPLVLSFGSEVELGVVQMATGLGMLLGGVMISTWGGPKDKKIPAVIAAIALSSIGYVIASLHPSVAFPAVGQFVVSFFLPASAALSQAVWQVKVPADIQGRVFSIRAMIAFSIIPLANLIAGPLADKVFVPMMSAGGLLSDSIFARLIGTGTGRGFAMVFLLSGVFLVGLSLLVLAYPRVRNLEKEIPDAIPDDQEEIVTEAVPGDAVPVPIGD